jgi:hypothetical protein
MGTEGQVLSSDDQVRVERHVELVNAILRVLNERGCGPRFRVAEPGCKPTWEFECDGITPGINWYLDRATPKLDPEWPEAAWYYSHCAIRRESLGPVSGDDYLSMQNELTQFGPVSPLFDDLRRLLAIGQRVCASPQEFAKLPWVSVRPRYQVVELLAWSHDYWCHFHESYAETTQQSFIIISLTPFLELDRKSPPGIHDGLLSPKHPQFGNVMPRS